MAERNEKVLERVRQELEREPGLGSRKLYDMIRESDPSIADNTPQQFHARYVLPIKREQAARQRGGKPVRRRGKQRQTAEPDRGRKRDTGARTRTGAEGASEGPQQQRRRRTRGQPDRDRVREIFLQFARDFAAAESRSEIVRVLSQLDQYVDEIVQTR